MMCTVFYPVGYELEFHAPFVAIVVGNKSWPEETNRNNTAIYVKRIMKELDSETS